MWWRRRDRRQLRLRLDFRSWYGSFRLESQLERQLDEPRIAGVYDLAERRAVDGLAVRIATCIIEQVEIRIIHNIEGFHAQLAEKALRNGNPLEDRHVKIDYSGAAQDAPAGLAES